MSTLVFVLHTIAERKAGEMLAQLKRGTPNPQGKNQYAVVPSDDGQNQSEYQAALEETGTSRQDANRWQKIASEGCAARF